MRIFASWTRGFGLNVITSASKPELEGHAMSIESPTSDADLLNLLKARGPMGVAELSEAMQVTPTAVRQRLVRLLSQEAIKREATRHGRGRPKHRYWITEKGLQRFNPAQ
jgi:predicted ArsR family transcriptional regulator